MSECQKCSGNRVADVSGKTSDMCSVSIEGSDMDGYVPKDMGIGGGDYLEFSYCLDCGQMQGNFPKPPTKLEGPL
jgi:hypothetical protein